MYKTSNSFCIYFINTFSTSMHKTAQFTGEPPRWKHKSLTDHCCCPSCLHRAPHPPPAIPPRERGGRRAAATATAAKPFPGETERIAENKKDLSSARSPDSMLKSCPLVGVCVSKVLHQTSLTMTPQPRELWPWTCPPSSLNTAQKTIWDHKSLED